MKKGAERVLTELENSKYPDGAPENFKTRKRLEIALREKGRREGTYGTGIGGKIICQRRTLILTG